MNVALPAFILFAALLPGFIFRSRLKRAERTSLDYSPFGRVVSEAVLWAAALHGTWTALSYYNGHPVDYGVVLRLLSSNLTQHAGAIDAVSNRFGLVALYFGSLYATAWFFPAVLRLAISRFRLDRVGHPLSGWVRFNDAPWYYLLTGADFPADKSPDYLMVTAVVEVAGEAYLFRGVLDDFYFDPDGKLDRLVLENVSRRKIGDDRKGDEPEPERFYEVAGDYFVIQYSQVLTLNVHYIKLQLVGGAGQAAGSSSATGAAEALSHNIDAPTETVR